MANTTTWERLEAGYYRMRGAEGGAHVRRAGRQSWEAIYQNRDGERVRENFSSAKEAKTHVEANRAGR